jgi:peroxiredoxin
MPNYIRSYTSHLAVILIFGLAGCASEPETPVAVKSVEKALVKARVAEEAKQPLGSEIGAGLQAAEATELQAAPRHDNSESVGPKLMAPGNQLQPQVARSDAAEPKRRTAFYRADSAPAEIPPVMLSKGHEAICKVKVGDAMPEMELELIGDGERAKLADLFGEKATVVVFWKTDRRMAREQLADLVPDVVELFGDKGVRVVGIAVEESPQKAEAVLEEAGAEFANLLDSDGEAFAQVGSEKLPRTYLLDPQGKILWFDIEYSHSTRRELHEALRAMAGDAGSKQE